MIAYVQVPGTGLRLRAEILRSALQRSAGMRIVMLHYAHARSRRRALRRVTQPIA